ncbi:hypothetical protein KR059_007170 [Drosophila kikkawai]|nr:hypothetical protein KR059_007170 [Drosophila kikkawai]
MPRLFNSRVKNKCSPCNGIYLLLLCFIFLVMVMQLQRENLEKKDILVAPPPPRIFCIIVTYEYRHQHAGIHILRTWAKHCDHFVFVSDDIDHFLEPAVFLHLHSRWERIRAHLEYVHGYHIHKGDWFLYANDDNFVVVENLREMLSTYSPDELVYFGCKLRTPNGLAFMHQGSGIVFSRAALEAFVLEALPNSSICSPVKVDSEATEELGRCLTNVNVLAGDSRDEWRGHRFLPFEVDLHLGGRMNKSQDHHKYYLDHTYYPVIDLSFPVSMQFICSHLEHIMDIYNLYYFTYKVRIFGGHQEVEQITEDQEERVFWNKKVAQS